MYSNQGNRAVSAASSPAPTAYRPTCTAHKAAGVLGAEPRAGYLAKREPVSLALVPTREHVCVKVSNHAEQHLAVRSNRDLAAGARSAGPLEAHNWPSVLIQGHGERREVSLVIEHRQTSFVR